MFCRAHGAQIIYENLRATVTGDRIFDLFSWLKIKGVPLSRIEKLFLNNGFPYIYNHADELQEKYGIQELTAPPRQVHQVTKKGTLMLKCPVCKKTSSADKWTVFHHVHCPEEVYIQVIKAVSEGVGMRSIGRIFGIDKDTVGRYIDRAAEQCGRVHRYFFRDLQVQECQLDEMWSFVGKKEKRLNELEKLQGEFGDIWIWIGFDAVNKLVFAKEIGKRTFKMAMHLIKKVWERTAEECIPFFTSDNLHYYEDALRYFYATKEHRNGNLHIEPHPDLDYAKVCKKREAGRVVEVEIEVCFGEKERILQRLEQSKVSNHVNVSFVERQNLTRRMNNRRLTRKTLGFSKKLQRHMNAIEIELALYHFCKPHRSLTEVLPTGTGIKRTPCMAAGLTEHIWSVEELLTFRPPH